MSRPLAPVHVSSIAPYQPGKPIDELRRELGGAWPSEGAIKLASNENPLGPSPRARAAFAEAASGLSLYPDGGAFELRARIAAHHGLDREQVFVGAGSNEVINLVVQAFCGEGEEVLTPRYQFLCYRLAAEGLGRALRECDNGPGFALSVDALLDAARDTTKVLFLANPNNPTGRHLSAAELARLARALPPHVVLVIDEAYVEYVDAADYASALPLLAERERLIVMRTFSKAYGLAGLRVGYGLARQPLVELLNRVRLPFNTSSVAQAVAIAALEDQAHVARSRCENLVERARVAAALAERGFEVTPSQCNFILARVPRGFTGPSLYDALLGRGVIVRPLLPYALPEHVRISVGTAAENTRLLAELDALGPGAAR